MSDSGVVSRICGGLLRCRWRRCDGVSPVRLSTRTASPISATGAPRLRSISYVSALSGVAGVLPAQDNEILRADAFSYRIYCVNATVAMDTNVANLNYNRNLNQNLHELRTTFFWPLLPTGNTGKGKQTFRATIGGQLVSTNSNGLDLYFYQAQNYTNAP